MLTMILRALRKQTRDKNTKSAGKQAAGAVLVADGLVGLENPLDGKKSRAGIGGALIGIIVGVVFMAVGVLMGSVGTADEGDVVVEGTVIEARARRGSDSTTYAAVVEYVDPATGTSYTATSAISSSRRPTIGSTKGVAFPPDNPGDGEVLSSGARWFRWGFIGVGAIVALTSTWTFAVRALSIGAGIKLMIDGRRERHDDGDTRNAFTVLAEGADDVIDEVRTEARREESAPAAEDERSASRTLPPAGWYADPGEPTLLRWFDGNDWTEFTQVRPAA